MQGGPEKGGDRKLEPWVEKFKDGLAAQFQGRGRAMTR